MKISIIGAGIGGLSAACLLARKGHSVTIFERNDNVGGKMNQIQTDEFRFDTGPSLFTMPYILDELYLQCGTSIEQELELEPLDINCRYFFQDGTIFNNYTDLNLTLDEISNFAPNDVGAFLQFLDYAEDLSHKTTPAFVRNPLYDFSDLKDLNFFSFLGIDAFTTVSKRVDKTFESDKLRQFFKRFATYNGSSPYQAPATLNVIPHIELGEGGYYVKGGLYKIAESLLNLASSLGVQFLYNAHVEKINISDGSVSSVELTNGEIVISDLVIANSDATETISKLLKAHLPEKKLQASKRIEPSCSGFVLMLGIDTKYEQLIHHNIFFSDDYKREFDQIFVDKVMPDDPTIYIANTSYSDDGHAPNGGSNLFILVNAPYLSEHYDWEYYEEVYTKLVIKTLERRGLHHLSEHIVYKKCITPLDFYQKYRSNKGSIYGTSSNSKMAAFVRPRNKFRGIEGLYMVGGSTHPGGGIPLSIQSALNAVELIDRYE
ncbi:phytoene desaturase family protein [Balneola vulgaris]|uniref:phytoene desaturase family protein n=1 Tax=Balneola vulgaris TaxID=287535 RepID=UPI00058DE5CC|nr:phytoene desaturase family protein [Balneola vulgaris]